MRKIYISLGCALLMQFSNSLSAQVFIDEDFSGTTGTTPPSGWANNEILTDGGIWMFDNPGDRVLNNPISAPFAVFDSDYLGTYGEEAALESSVFDASAATDDIYLTFDQYFRSNDDFEECHVEVWDGTAWQEVYLNSSTTANPEQQVINITSAVDGASNAKVRFRWVGDYDWYWIVDNVKVQTSSCAPVTAITPGAFTSNSIHISWTAGGSETNWDIEYGPSGFTQGTGTMTSSSTASYTAGALTGDTQYQFYVRANCGAGNESVWVGPLNAHTHSYCQVAGEDGYAYINNFATTGGLSNISNLNSGFNGYEHNTSMIVSTYNGGPGINFNTDFDGSYFGLGIWVDWDNDTTFDASEQVFISDDYYDSYSESLDIPAGTAVGTYRMRVMGAYDNGEPDDACTLDDEEGEVEDYTLQIIPVPSCLPISGLALENVTANSAEINWVAGAAETDWDIEYGPVGFIHGTGTMGSATDTLFSAGSLTVNTHYDFYVRADCGGSQSPWVGPITVFTGYCEVAGQNDSYYIDNFSISGGIDTLSNLNSGYSTGYEDNTSMSVSSFDGAPALDFSIDFSAGTYGLGIWVDWNSDLVFDASEEMFVSDDYYFSYDGSFSVPAGTAIGTYTMRVLADYNSQVPSNPCNLNFDTGEIEDYTIEITSPPSCLPIADLAIATQTSTSIDITWTAQGSETNWDIEYGPAGFTQGSGTTTSTTTTTFSLGSLPANTDYDFYVRANCGGGDESLWNHITGRTGYCTVQGSDDGAFINNFSTSGGLTSNISNLSSGYSTNGYQDASAMVVSSFAGGPDVNFHANFDGNSFGLGIWIDWNNDLIFDGSEQVFVSDDYYDSYSESFGVPAGAAVGSYRMRVMGTWDDGSPTNACNIDDEEGEVEDYTFEVLPTPSCLPVSDILISNETTTSLDLIWNADGSQSLWNIQWGPAGYTPGTGTELGSAQSTDIVYTINGLDGSTTYDIYIQADCGVDSSYWTLASGTTLCVPIASLPWLENFDAMTQVDYDLFPNCWISENGEWLTDDTDQNSTINSAPYSGNNFLAIQGFYNEDYIWTPEFELTAGGNYEFSFMWAGDGNPDWNGEAFVNSDQTSTDAVSLGDSFVDFSDDTDTDYKKVTYCFSPDSTGVYSFGIHVTSDYYNYNLTFDDFRLVERTGSAGTDGALNVCQIGGLVELNDIITMDDQSGVWSFGPNPATIVNDTLFNPQFVPSGTVYVNYITTGCLVDTATAAVTIYGPSMAGGDGTISACKNEPLDLLSGLSGTVNLGGHWYDPTNALLPESEITTGNFPGSFNYKYITGNGVCPNDTAQVVLTITNCNWLSITENELDGVTLYPNPSSGKVFIESTFTTGSFNLVITDVNGRVIENESNTIVAGTNTVNLDNVQRGTYFFKLSNNNAEKVYRVVIE